MKFQWYLMFLFSDKTHPHLELEHKKGHLVNTVKIVWKFYNIQTESVGWWSSDLGEESCASSKRFGDSDSRQIKYRY